MWQRLKNWRNWYWAFRTYGAMSPDLRVRRRVRQQLEQRPYLGEQEWIEQCCQLAGIAAPIATFAYSHLQRYSGLEIGRVRLSDRLEADLRWTEICWFDWTFTLCQDFGKSFAVDIAELIQESNFVTVSDLLRWLNDRWIPDSAQSSAQEV